ncbi:MAG: hypothetical protein HYT12_03840 [Candidatus Liptonbacteria bacterium]|nr:hypothetical protein [Candidatus Liptonbacteria bacterium]
MKKRRLWLLTLLLALVLFLSLPAYSKESDFHYPNFSSEKSQALEEILYIFGYLIPKYYYKPLPNIDECVQKVLNGGLAACLDKNSRYLPKSQMDERAWEENDDEYFGIGATLMKDCDSVLVSSVEENSPAYVAGIMARDLIVGVSDASHAIQSTSGKSVYEVAAMIRGPKDSFVNIVVRRGDAEINFQVQRKAIPVKLVESRLISPEISYVSIKSFDSFSISQKVNSALNGVAAKPGTRIVIDLRDNPGGFLRETMKILVLFENKPRNILVTERKYLNSSYVDSVNTVADMIYDYPAILSWFGKYSDRKIAVLVNGNSASSAEILAGYLQQKGATLIGEQTYKKGTVQTDFHGASGGTLHLTTAEYLLGNSKVKVDGIGITPNVIIKNPDGWVRGDTANDLQLQKAIEVLSGSATLTTGNN